MKITITKSKTIQWLSISSTILSLLIGATTLARGQRPFLDTFSIIGKRNKVLFALYGITTSIALGCNMVVATNNTPYTNDKIQKIHKYIVYTAMSVSIITLLITTFVHGIDPPDWDIKRQVHVAASMIFGISGLILSVYLLILNFIKNKSWQFSLIYLIALVASAAYFLTKTIQLGWFTAITQFIIIEVNIFALLCKNYLEPKWTNAPNNK